jgi:tyrosyl-tRNA synthetase
VARITPGTDGVAKQSKSLGNYIALADIPRDMFGKAMSIPDHLTRLYLEVYTDVPLAEIAELDDPYAAKKRLAAELCRRYHGEEVAAAETAFWEETIAARRTPLARAHAPIMSACFRSSNTASTASADNACGRPDAASRIRQTAASNRATRAAPPHPASVATAT